MKIICMACGGSSSKVKAEEALAQIKKSMGNQQIAQDGCIFDLKMGWQISQLN